MNTIVDQNIPQLSKQQTMPVNESIIPPMQSVPMTRRARWGKQLMAGKAAVINSLPNWFAVYAFSSYLIALLGVGFMNSAYAMEWYFWLFGIVWVAGFFYMTVEFTKRWSVLRIRTSKSFESHLFKTGFLIRAIYVIFIYIFYMQMTGLPHEFQGADSISYIDVAEDWNLYWETGHLREELSEYIQHNFSDFGFPFYEMIFVRIFGTDACYVILRLLNALLGAYTSILIYRIVRRSMDETSARIAAIFCMLHPVLICYAGILLKEVLMTFLVVLFIDLGDKLLRNRRYSFGTIAPLISVGLSLFMFRTVLGMIAFMALGFAIVMMSGRIVSVGKKLTLGVIITGILFMAVSDNIMREINQITNADVRGQQEVSMTKRYGTEGGKKSGNAFAKYAGVAVFAPLIFTIPFPTMVNATEGQEDMRLIHGGNWMRNVMSGFVILAMFMLLLSGDWRKYTLPLAMLLGYLLMLSFTEFAHSLRFHIPVMPFEMMFAAYAITNMRKKHRNWYLIWCLFMVVACFAWNWFKLAGRGLS